MKEEAGRAVSSGSWWIFLAVGLVIAAVLIILVLISASRKKKSRGSGTMSGWKLKEGVKTEAYEDVKGQTVSPETEASDDKGEYVRSCFQVGAAQTVGSRSNQEDSYCISPWKDAEIVSRQGLLAAVADGVGGMSNGEVASTTLMQTFSETFGSLSPELTAQQKLLELTSKGQQAVLRLNREGSHCGTTLVALLIENGYLSTLSVGDSRICLYRGGGLLQLNREHVLGRESDEYQALHFTEEEADERKRRLITSYIGKDGLKLIDRTLNPIRLISGDRILLMSDGVFGTLTDDEMIALLNKEPQEAAQAIIQAVEDHRKPYQDNATVVIVGL